MTDRNDRKYESEEAVLQRALVQLSFIALAADHTRWSVRGASDEVVRAGLLRVAVDARDGCEAVADALRELDVPPDARPATIARTMTARYIPEGWRSPRESLERALSYLSTLKGSLIRSRDALPHRTDDGQAHIALDHAISSVDDADQTLQSHAIE
jgi:starvation-inducible DNA-binding protein